MYKRLSVIGYNSRMITAAAGLPSAWFLDLFPFPFLWSRLIDVILQIDIMCMGKPASKPVAFTVRRC